MQPIAPQQLPAPTSPPPPSWGQPATASAPAAQRAPMAGWRGLAAVAAIGVVAVGAVLGAVGHSSGGSSSPQPSAVAVGDASEGYRYLLGVQPTRAEATCVARSAGSDALAAMAADPEALRPAEVTALAQAYGTCAAPEVFAQSVAQSMAASLDLDAAAETCLEDAGGDLGRSGRTEVVAATLSGDEDAVISYVRTYYQHCLA